MAGTWKVKTRGNRPGSRWLLQYESEFETDARAEYLRLLAERTQGAVILVSDRDFIVDRGQCRFRAHARLEGDVDLKEQINEASRQLGDARTDYDAAKAKLDEADDRVRRWGAILASLEKAQAVMEADVAPGRRGRPAKAAVLAETPDEEAKAASAEGA
jgi:DNA repair exonuclease SbcCD ATPase subunit